MKAADFMLLVRRMRSAQKYYRKLDDLSDMEKKMDALFKMKKLEKQVDLAEIDDIANLVTESPIA